MAKIQYGTTEANESYAFTKVTFDKVHWSAPKKNRSLLKLMVIVIVLTLLNPNMKTKLPCHPPLLRERGLNYKTMLLIKR
jgi:hypothetical protein